MEEHDALLRAIAWKSGRLEWKLHQAQQLIHASIEDLPPEIKEAAMLCCRRFGKSFYGCVRAIMKGLQRSGHITRIIGPEIKQTRGIVRYNMAKICEELPKLGLRNFVRWVGYDNMYYVGDQGSAIFLGGYDSQEDNQRGGEAHEILIEETGSSDPEQYSYQMRDVLKPQLLKTRGRLIHLTTLPPIPDHPFAIETIPQTQLDRAFYSYTIYQDPLATPEIIADAIKDCGGEHTDTFKREYLNIQIRDRNRVIIPDFDETTHVIPFDLPLETHFEIYVDWGGVRDLTVALLTGFDFLQAKDLYIDELVWQANTPTEFIVKDLKRWQKAHNIGAIYADAPGQLLVDLRLTHGLQVSMPKKDDWEAAINQLAVRYALKKIMVHPRCRLLIQTARSGTFNDHKTDFARSTTMGHMDAIATQMYASRCMNRESPYGASVWSRDHTFVLPKADDPGPQSLVPQSFGGRGMKKFGGFK